ncbi:MAG: GNAT family N-acetyltransferase [Bacteroidetes bacterium]|nr:GNAT family N-acetyltransferase [Bacteroidota bacterium]
MGQNYFDMGNNLDLHTLENYGKSQLFRCFQKSFRDYPVSFNMTQEQFNRKFINRLNIRLDLSVGAFVGNQLTGFIFTSIDHFRGLFTAYNGGTGVIPSFRGKGLTYSMYQFLIPQLKEIGVTKCLLEVLQQNEFAQKAYQRVGFTTTVTLKCFKRKEEDSIHLKPGEVFQISWIPQPDWALYKTFSNFSPCFLDTPQLLSHILAKLKIIEAKDQQGRTVGYAIYSPNTGRISQFGVHKKFRRLGIGSSMFKFITNLSPAPTYTVMNIPSGETAIIKFLKKLGFQNEIDQYEMIMKL